MPVDRAIHATPPRAKYAGIMLAVTIVAAGCAAMLPLLMGTPNRVALFASGAVLVGSVATFLPALLRVDRQSWGLVVLGSSMARTMAILAFTLFIDKSRDLGDARTALWIGAMVGAGVVLIVESAVSIRILAAMDRVTSASRISGPHTAPQA